ncbi:hypothetical protein GQ43DRAFT_465739 [Delitschia confertaspora ATCC 74209]|uniref:Uncharacterized protein n=1 Tax=Delitschia confertaspora ATCC 74209 TaxID=1513339 RepID=A0A9P4MSQ6_9PLEO|nr:hypothetical protein GQ43DRAFT_465739 [Delitschia confertaspora ATCC 74209]
MNTSYYILEDDQPWTTARCNRLLRPISSRLATLRKELEKSRFRASEISNTLGITAKVASSQTQTTKERKPRGFEKRTDPDWVPCGKLGTGAGRKRTYGGRAGQSTASSKSNPMKPPVGRPGEVSVPTPFISRSLGRLQDSPQTQGSPLQHAGKRRKPFFIKQSDDFKAFKKGMEARRYAEINGLLEAYRNLLQATRPGHEKSRKGTRSLMSTCLRQVPTYIALEEYWAAEDEDEEDDTRDLPNEIYTELENRGACSGQGWRPLKEIVQAHATALLCDAIEDGLLDIGKLLGFYKLCQSARAWDELEKLLGSFLVALKPLSPPTSVQANLFSDQTSCYMWMVEDFVTGTGRHQFLYDTMEYMLAQDLLPVEWLATECMRPIWSRVIRVLSDRNHRNHANAARLLETAISVGAGLSADDVFEDGDVEIVTKQAKLSSKAAIRDALNNTFSSLLTLLSGITLVSNTRAEESDEGTVQSVTWILDSLVIGLLRRKNIRSDLELLDPELENMETFARRALWCTGAAFLVHLGGCQLGKHMISIDTSAIVSSFNWIIRNYSAADLDVSSILESLPTFISSTAQCSGKAWGDDGFDQLQRLVHALLSTHGARLRHPSWNLKRIALDSCLEFAQTTKIGEHFAYARKIEKSLTKLGQHLTTRSPEKAIASPTTSNGFRWEEGIGEWVACTPFLKKEIKQLPQKSKSTRAFELPPTPLNSQSEGESLLLNNDTTLVEDHEDLPDYVESLPGSPAPSLPRESSPPLQSSPTKPVERRKNPKRTSLFLEIVVPVSKKTRLSPPESGSSGQASQLNLMSEAHMAFTPCHNPPQRPQWKSTRTTTNPMLLQTTRIAERSLTLDCRPLTRQLRGRRQRSSYTETESDSNSKETLSDHQVATTVRDRRGNARVLVVIPANERRINSLFLSNSISKAKVQSDEDELYVSNSSAHNHKENKPPVRKSKRTTASMVQKSAPQRSPSRRVWEKKQASLMDLVDLSEDELSFA